MEEPQITWYIIEDNSVVPYSEYYSGSYKPGDVIEISMQLWNNRWGQTNVLNAVNARLALFFENIEDSILLSLCKVSINGSLFSDLEIVGNKGYISLGDMSGETNDGTSSYKNNYNTITLKFGPIENGMKNSLKNLLLDPQYDSKGGV